MKKIVSFLLVVVMLAALAACGKTDAPAAAGQQTEQGFTSLHVGVARGDITPKNPIGIHINGGGDPNRLATGILDKQTITCIAITDKNNQTVLIYSQDIHNPVAKSFTNKCRTDISAATGVPVENIYMTATHTHSSLLPTDTTTPANIEFTNQYFATVLSTAKEALADRAPATMFGGAVDAKEASGQDMAFVRHYTISNGTVAGSNFGNFGAGTITGHPYEADQEAQLIKFVREGKDKDVLLMNWPCHSTFNGTTTLLNVSSDYPAPLRDYIEANTDCVFGIFLGGAGDQTPRSNWREDNHGLEYKEYGEALGKIIVDHLAVESNLTQFTDDAFKFNRYTFVANSQKSDPAVFAEAKDVYDYFLENGQTKGTTYAVGKGFQSPYEARAIVSRADLPDTIEVPIEAVSLGNMSFVFAPYEMAGGHAMNIKDNTPFDMTFIFAYCNDNLCYIPVEVNYEYNDNHGSYEAYDSKFEKGTGTALANKYLEMLAELKG